LARPAASDERDDLAARDPHGDVGEHVVHAVPLVHVAKFAGRRGVRSGAAFGGVRRGGHERYLKARRSSARTTASVPIPSSAYTMSPKMMMSMRRKSRAFMMRKPIPLSALICSATIKVSQAIASD